MKNYPLEPMSIGEDTYALMSKGHHDIHTFVKEVRKHWSWPLGVPEHVYMKTMPAHEDGYACWYQPVPKGTRGAWPATYVSEAYGEDRYEVKHPKGKG